MKRISGVLVLGLISTTAMADFNLAKSAKAVICFGEDNFSVSLNAKRTALKAETEGESLGYKKIFRTASDGLTYIMYITSEGALKMTNKGDFFRFHGDDAFSKVRCKVSDRD